MKFFLLSLFVLISGIVCGQDIEDKVVEADAAANLTKYFDLKSNMNETVNWASKNEDAIRSCMKIKILEDLGEGKFKVEKETAKGDFSWYMKEAKGATKSGKYMYKSIFEKPAVGGVVYSESKIVIESGQDGRGSRVTIKMSAGVNNPRVHTRDMVVDFNNSIRNVKRLMESHLN
jgi:hypothetical protein